MPTMIENAYTEYQLDESEALSAAILSPLQLAHLQNQIAAYAKERAVLAINYEATDPVQSYMLAQQKLLGAIEALQYLRALHENAVNTLTTIVNDRKTEQ